MYVFQMANSQELCVCVCVHKVNFTLKFYCLIGKRHFSSPRSKLNALTAKREKMLQANDEQVKVLFKSVMLWLKTSAGTTQTWPCYIGKIHILHSSK